MRRPRVKQSPIIWSGHQLRMHIQQCENWELLIWAGLISKLEYSNASPTNNPNKRISMRSIPNWSYQSLSPIFSAKLKSCLKAIVPNNKEDNWPVYWIVSAEKFMTCIVTMPARSCPCRRNARSLKEKIRRSRSSMGNSEDIQQSRAAKVGKLVEVV